jgi:hypothetical protein
LSRAWACGRLGMLGGYSTPAQAPMSSDDPDLDVYRAAFAAYLKAVAAHRRTADKPLPYDLVDAVGKVVWHLPFLDTLIAGDIREALNHIHQWQTQLLSLKAWVEVLASSHLSDDDSWTVRSDLVEPLATWCLLQPAATRDRLGSMATNLVHHGRLTGDAGYTDVLEGDKGNRFLSRRALEEQLTRIGASCSATPAFVERLQVLDGPQFRAQTSDFRNRASHSIAPRLDVGFTQMVTRRIEARDDLIEQPDGTWARVTDPTRSVVSYGFGGTPPLPLSKAVAWLNVEYRKGRLAVEAYLSMVAEVLSRLTDRA